MMPSGGTESSVIVVSRGLGAQRWRWRWMNEVIAKMIHSMTEGEECLVLVAARIWWRLPMRRRSAIGLAAEAARIVCKYTRSL